MHQTEPYTICPRACSFLVEKVCDAMHAAEIQSHLRQVALSPVHVSGHGGLRRRRAGAEGVVQHLCRSRLHPYARSERVCTRRYVNKNRCIISPVGSIKCMARVRAVDVLLCM